MHIRTFVASIAGAAAVYVVVAACGTSSPSSSSTSAASSAGGSVVDAIVDQLTSPVPDALAGPTPPDVADESCTKTFTPPSGPAQLYAEHAYPGKTAADLGAVHVVVTSTASLVLPGYDSFATTPYVRDGAAAVPCGAVGASNYSKVTFILP